jgi:DNA-directed RNA polymerase specialized sigma24 family protein
MPTSRGSPMELRLTLLIHGRLVQVTTENGLPQMKKERDPTPAEFENMLDWLDADRDAAGRKYETIRQRLIKVFVSRGCVDAEALVDEVMNRVAIRIEEVAKTYVGDPALYFYGFVQNVYLESLRTPAAKVPPPTTSSEELEREDRCLTQCMEPLPAADRDLVLRYYHEEKRAKIDYRRKLAEELGITLNALRIRAYRIRFQLQQCVEACLAYEPAR